MKLFILFLFSVASLTTISSVHAGQLEEFQQPYGPLQQMPQWQMTGISPVSVQPGPWARHEFMTQSPQFIQTGFAPGHVYQSGRCPTGKCPSGECHSPWCPTPQVRMKPVFQTETTTCFRTEWETEYCDQDVTIERPVYETHYREQTYQVCRPVWETVEREVQRQVCKPVIETIEQCFQKTVYRQVTETIEQERCFTEVVPVTTYKTITKDEGCWIEQPYQEPGRYVTRKICDPCGRVRYCTVRIPGRTCYKRVWQPKIVNCQIPCTTYQTQVVKKLCPVQVCRTVPEVVTCKVPVQVTRYVHETVCEKVPVKVCRWETETKTCKVPYQVCKMETEVVTRKVPRRVARQVPYEVTRQVCRWIPCETPEITACAVKCLTCGCQSTDACRCTNGACAAGNCDLPEPTAESDIAPEPAFDESQTMPEVQMPDAEFDQMTQLNRGQFPVAY